MRGYNDILKIRRFEEQAYNLGLRIDYLRVSRTSGKDQN
jgi:hypothetical protein